MNKFKGYSPTFWLVGILVLVGGVIAAFVLLPTFTATPGNNGPDIHVPKLQNVPPSNSPPIKFEIKEMR